MLTAFLNSFVRNGVAAGDQVLVVLSAAKLNALQESLGAQAALVSFADMDSVGANPARIIPLWRSFVDGLKPGQLARGVGEPVIAQRGPAELAECQIHESLLNLAFAGCPPFWLLCPYDTTILDEAVLEEARRSHAYIAGLAHMPVVNGQYVAGEARNALVREDLPREPTDASRSSFDHSSVAISRHSVRAHGEHFGLSQAAAEDLSLAVHEVITNSLKYGGGQGRLSIWTDSEAIICEVRDDGHFSNPLAGRSRPEFNGESGRGLWMANQLCDLVQIRTGPDGTVVRLHKRHRRDRV